MKDSDFERQFDEIYKEIKRQFNVLLQFDNSQDSKISIFLGFIFLAIVQLLTYERLFESFLATNLSSAFFFSFLICVVYSGYSAIKAYFMKKYGIGPDILSLIKIYREGESEDFKQKIARGVFDHKERNSAIMLKKIIYMKRMIVSFIIGFILIILAFLISIFNLQVTINVG